MASYTITDAETLLQVKAHVIRYWEQEVPLVKSGRDNNGRRVYSGRDMQILLRLKHLLHDRRFTIEGAKQELLRELTDDSQDMRSLISVLRSELLELYYYLNERRRS